MIKAGESILLIFRFFIHQVGKIFELMNKFEILPGISYFMFFLGIIVISIFIKIIRFGYEDDFKNSFRNNLPGLDIGYKGKHSSEGYVPKHNKRIAKKRRRW